MIEYESLGKFGAEIITNSNTATSKNYCAITMIEDSVFTTLTPGFAGGSSGSSSASVIFPKGFTIFGAFTAVTLQSGKVLCYKAFVS